MKNKNSLKHKVLTYMKNTTNRFMLGVLILVLAFPAYTGSLANVFGDVVGLIYGISWILLTLIYFVLIVAAAWYKE